MQQELVAIILPALGMWSIGQNAAFSEHGHDAYQIKENHFKFRNSK